MSNHNKDNHLSELVRGAILSFSNAEQLFNEANLLFTNKALSISNLSKALLKKRRFKVQQEYQPSRLKGA